MSIKIKDYEKQKKWLYVSAFVLLVSNFIGLTLEPEQGGPLFSLRISDRLDVSAIAAGVTLLLFLRLLMEWADLPIYERMRSFAIVDHFLVTSIAATALIIYCNSWIDNADEYVVFGIGVSVVLISLLVWGRKLGIHSIASDRLRAFGKKKYETEEEELERLAQLVTYRLYFNPDNIALSKQITFEKDNRVGLGRNSNEFEWRVGNGRLEILDRYREVFSRFRFHKKSLTWVHTNEADTKSLKNQYMEIDAE